MDAAERRRKIQECLSESTAPVSATALANEKVVSYQCPTSNRNGTGMVSFGVQWYLISVLHQTATMQPYNITMSGGILSVSYIKPQRCSHTTLQ